MPVSIWLGIVRHLLTAVGGVLVSKGILSAGLLDTILGAILAILPTIWSAVEKIQTKDESDWRASTAAATGKDPDPPKGTTAASNPGIAAP